LKRNHRKEKKAGASPAHMTTLRISSPRLEGKRAKPGLLGDFKREKNEKKKEKGSNTRKAPYTSIEKKRGHKNLLSGLNDEKEESRGGDLKKKTERGGMV